MTAETKRLCLKRWGHALLPCGSVRRFAAGIMVIIGFGRIGLYSSTVLTHILPQLSTGILLVVIGIAVYASQPCRLLLRGRIIAALASLLIAGLAWDTGAIGVTSLVETWIALALLREVFTSHDF